MEEPKDNYGFGISFHFKKIVEISILSIKIHKNYVSFKKTIFLKGKICFNYMSTKHSQNCLKWWF